jgi:thymidine kinase
MFAGKTTRMMEIYKEKGGIILNYSETDWKVGVVLNHDQDVAPCIHLSSLEQASKSIHDVKTIYINEAQFFPDLLEFINRWEHKDIYLFGLDGDFQRKPMGQILQVIPLCDTVEKLHGKCNRCPSDSLFSKRITQDKQQILLDDSAYMPLCRKCYLNI